MVYEDVKQVSSEFTRTLPAEIPVMTTYPIKRAPLWHVLEVLGANSKWYGAWLDAVKQPTPQRYGRKSSSLKTAQFSGRSVEASMTCAGKQKSIQKPLQLASAFSGSMLAQYLRPCAFTAASSSKSIWTRHVALLARVLLATDVPSSRRRCGAFILRIQLPLNFAGSPLRLRDFLFEFCARYLLTNW